MVLCPVSEVFSRLPPHSSPHRHRKGEGWGIKGQSSTEGPWGLYALPRPGGDQPPSCSAPQLTCRILPPGRGPMGHGCCQKLLPLQLEEQRERKLRKKERKLEEPAGYRASAIGRKGPRLSRPGSASGNPTPQHYWGEGSLALGRPILKDSLHSMDSFINSFRKS